jgi:hypothetical protein
MLLRSEAINTGREIADGLQFPGALGKTDVELVFEAGISLRSRRENRSPVGPYAPPGE